MRNLAREVLEEFAAAAVPGHHHHERIDGDCLDTESARRCWVARQAAKGLCKSCRRNVKPGRKYCEKHLALASERMRKRVTTMKTKAEKAEAEVKRLRALLRSRSIPLRPTEVKP